MKPTPLALLIIAIAFSCSNPPTTDAILKSIEGNYYFGSLKDNGLFVEENCIIHSGEKLVIEKSANAYIIRQLQLNTLEYVVQKAEQKGKQITVIAYDSDIDGESENRPERKFIFTVADFLEMNFEDRVSFLVPVDSTDKYSFIRCDMQENESDDSSPTSVQELDETSSEGQLITEFLKLMDPAVGHPIYFSEGQQIKFSSPGPGVMPMVDTLSNEEALKKALKRFGKFSPTVLAQWKQQGKFYNEQPDFCNPEKAGVYYYVELDKQMKPTKGNIFLVDDSAGMPQVEFALTFYWDENHALILSDISTTDCSA